MADRPADLEIDQDLEFQRRSWRAQRVGWALMALFVAAALAGLLGPGPLSRANASAPGHFVADYPRFARYQAPETLRVQIESPASARGTVRLWLDRGLLDSAQIHTVTPEPQRVEGAGDRLVYVFTMARPGDPLRVTFDLKPERIGLVRGRIGLDGPAGAEVGFRQIIYP